ncbi:pheromone receptor [Aspergillus foveolatus]|uniref:pheromone receptor n=1 Tax=Aspergillus foveolatus TaxID=210207 RepID=UPI003CCE492F
MDAPKMSPSAQAVVMQALSAIAVIVTSSTLALHWKNRNFPAAIMMGWFILLNLFNVINAFIWPTDDVDNWWDGAGLCDIEVKMLISSYVAIPGSLVCIFRSLACVLDISRATLIQTKRQRWTTRSVEVLFCVLIPLLAAATHLIYQGNRYFIFAVSGCVSSLDRSWVSFALGYLWPLVVCVIASYYCGLLLFRLRRYRNQFNEVLRAANSGLSRSRFLRLFFLAFIMLLALTPMQAYMVYVQVKLSIPWHPYSWSLLHGPGSSWGVIERIPTGGAVYFDRWIPVASAYTAFAFFGTGRDASRMYRSFLRPFGLDCCFSPMENTTSGSYPHTSGSAGSGAHLIPGRGKARSDLYHSTRKNSIDYTSSSRASSKDEDLEKNIPVSSVTENQVVSKKGWLKTGFAWFGNPFPFSFSPSACHEKMRSRSTPHLVVPASSNTVCTNAWAGSRQSRGSIDFDDSSESLSFKTDFIRVKQVIRQERESQV